MFGEHLQAFRKAKGWTLKELGKKVGYAENSVWQWEHELREPNLKTYHRLAEVLGVTAIQLWEGKVMNLDERSLSTRRELTQYDPTIPSTYLDEYLLYQKRITQHCDKWNIPYEFSKGRELLFFPIPPRNWEGMKLDGILLEVPEFSHWEEEYKEDPALPPLVFLSVGNAEEGYRVIENIECSVQLWELKMKEMELF